MKIIAIVIIAFIVMVIYLCFEIYYYKQQANYWKIVANEKDKLIDKYILKTTPQ